MNNSDYDRRRMHRLMPGLIMIGLGVLFLIGQFLPIGDWILLIMGLAFLVSYFVTRRDGLLWPAGILSGLGLAIIVGNALRLDGPMMAGAILLGLSGGFFSIYIIDQIFTPPTPVGPLWAGAGTGLAGVIFVLIGVGALTENVWGVVGQLWPIFLILAGISTVVGAFRRREG